MSSEEKNQRKWQIITTPDTNAHPPRRAHGCTSSNGRTHTYTMNKNLHQWLVHIKKKNQEVYAVNCWYPLTSRRTGPSTKLWSRDAKGNITQVTDLLLVLILEGLKACSNYNNIPTTKLKIAAKELKKQFQYCHQKRSVNKLLTSNYADFISLKI